MSLADDIRWVRQRPELGIPLALAIFAVAFSARVVFDPILQGLPFITLYPAIVLAGLLGGVRLGVGSAVLSAILAWYWIIPPIGSFGLDMAAAITLALFALSSSILLYIVHALDRAMDTIAKDRDQAAVLLQELQHRTANNLAFLSSLVHLQRKASSSSQDAQKALNSISQRIDTLSRIHRSLYGSAAANRPLHDHIEELCKNILQATGAKNIACAVEVQPATLDMNRLILLSRLIAELMTNSIKHAFANRDSGAITVRLEIDGDRHLLVVKDDGNGRPDDFKLASGHGLGLHIIAGLAKQLDGEISWSKAGGTAASLTFPVQGSVPAEDQAASPNGLLRTVRSAFGTPRHKKPATVLPRAKSDADGRAPLGITPNRDTVVADAKAALTHTAGGGTA